MNFTCVCAQLSDNPQEVYTSATSTAIQCNALLPPVSQNKAATPIQINIYGKNAERFSRFEKGNKIYLHGATLRFDLESRTFSLHGGTPTQVTNQFPIFNSVILSGRCVKDIDNQDARAFKTTENGLMICHQTLSVVTGKNQADLFNFYAMNSVDDKLNNAELLVNFTRKGTGLTINGRLVSSSWTDKETREQKIKTQIQINKMTLAPKSQGEPKPIEPKANVASEQEVSSLWGGKTADEELDPWTHASGGGLPDLPGQYGNAPELAEDPF